MLAQNQEHSHANRNNSDIVQLIEFKNFNELLRLVVQRRYKNLTLEQAAARIARRIAANGKERDNLRNKIAGWLDRKVPGRVSAHHLELIASHLGINKSPEIKKTWETLRDAAFRVSAKSKGQRKSSSKSLDSSTSTTPGQNLVPIKSPESKIDPFTAPKEEVHPFILDYSEADQEADIDDASDYPVPALYIDPRALKVIDKRPFLENKTQISLVTFFSVGIGLSVAYFSYNRVSNDPGNECDLLASAHWDTQKPPEIKGVYFSSIATEQAEKACKTAIAQQSYSDQEIARYYFQLGRIKDRKGDYIAASIDYKNSIKAYDYGASRLNLGILHENGQISGMPYPQQLDYRDVKQAALHYKKSAETDLPYGRYCYAIAILLGWDGNWDGTSDRLLAISHARKQLEQARQTIDNLSTSIDYKDEARRAKIVHLLGEIDSPATKTRHVSCESRAIVPIENEPLKFR